MNIRRFNLQDAQAVAGLIKRNLLEVNIRDYTKQEMLELAENYCEKNIIKIVQAAHMYVAFEQTVQTDTIIGTGTISSYNGSETDSVLQAVFVLPEYHAKGVGALIVKTLEEDELFLRAKRVWLFSSITSCVFYEKMGYSYVNNEKVLNSQGLYAMEKTKLT